MPESHLSSLIADKVEFEALGDHATISLQILHELVNKVHPRIPLVLLQQP